MSSTDPFVHVVGPAFPRRSTLLQPKVNSEVELEMDDGTRGFERAFHHKRLFQVHDTKSPPEPAKSSEACPGVILPLPPRYNCEALR